ncbi:MAG: hypothetical protein ACK48B_01215, partial [Dolichospermum sp.]
MIHNQSELAVSAEILIPLSVKERKELIMYHASFIDATDIVDVVLKTAYKYEKILSLIAPA